MVSRICGCWLALLIVTVSRSPGLWDEITAYIGERRIDFSRREGNSSARKQKKEEAMNASSFDLSGKRLAA